MDTARSSRRISALRVGVQPSPTGTVVTLHGDLDAATTGLLADELRPVYAEPHPPPVIIDLSDLQFCDSSGLGELLVTWRRMQRSGGKLALSGVHGICERLLHRTGVHHIFAIYATVTEAQAALAASRLSRQAPHLS
ncbi:STAS domain-containing protein [Nonomuraea sp. NPDC049152]|uniref:STAS domain-containing protein n=1 Tax=Nonomuraea sp. NPDC049152 TaxID=3154350 RepID=UPI0033F6FC72